MFDGDKVRYKNGNEIFNYFEKYDIPQDLKYLAKSQIR